MPPCKACQSFDIRSLLFESAGQDAQSTGLTGRLYSDTNDYRPPIPFFHKLHDSIVNLKQSAEQGCEACNLFWVTWIKTVNKPDITEEWLDRTFQGNVYLGCSGWIASRQGSPYITLAQKTANGSPRTLASFEPFADRDELPSDGLDLLGRSIYEDPASKECLAVATDWLDECLNHHSKCGGAANTEKPLPTRVIDVGNENTPPKLMITGGKCGDWIALSYCWGGDSVFVHNDSTVANLKAGIPLEQYPRTLRDAIIITRALGVKYIWIDALCIKQDSREDWAAEASKMREVYSGAIVTVSASNSPSTQSGIFSTRKVGMSKIGFDWNLEEKTGKVYLRSGSELWDHSLQTSALQTRGWTLQEGLLAPRTLSFGQQQMMWECPEHQADEGGRISQPTQEYRSKGFIQKMLQVGRQEVSKAEPTLFERLYIRTPKTEEWWKSLAIENPYDKWWEIVEQYMTRSLTKDFDVLPALSGLARAFEPVVKDEYLAGHWKKDLMASLMWSRNPRHPADESSRYDPTIPSEYLAPSWSWASILGNLSAMSTTWKTRDALALSALKVVEIINVQTITKGDDPFGQVIGGELKIRGRLFPIKTMPPVWSLDNQFLEEPSDLPKLSPFEKIVYNSFRTVDVAVYERYQSHKPHAGQTYGAVEIVRWKGAPGDGLPGLDFLMLESTGRKEDEYRRIGNVRVRKNPLPDMDEVTPDSFAFLTLENQAYDEVQKSKVKKRTITIV
ncbi:heterokaryon incompatibility protein-domain-containing protein [Rhexocercosporidium sp. MPI-PUGE-AT-0058]|nr:heterokaryon incompatibility protein-domain-containing protein [Rhexocercosporidium sp. MPI-PUGE-AT-0058]